MIKILALTDLNRDDDSQEEENEEQVTKEAQETIAVSEYMRALGLKQKGQAEIALVLFEALLQTQVLSDVPDDDKDNKLFSVKYNCYRNAGLIYEEQGELKKALKSLLHAADLDGTDVFIQCKIGRLSLRLNNLHLAKLAFENCLERNPNHFGAKDGYLQTLCKMEDIDAAYGFALKCFEDDRGYVRAIRVLKEIRDRFSGSLDYYDGIYGRAPKFAENCPIKVDYSNSVFPEPVEIGFTEENYATLSEDFKIPENDLNWVTFGKLILRVYQHLEDGNFSLTSWFSWDDWVGKVPEFKEPEPPKDVEMAEPEVSAETAEVNESIKNESMDVSEDKSIDEKAEDSENGESEESKKANNRRRCSDIDMLKEWGWHKNRRSSRKKQKEEEETIDTSVNGFLRRILPKYFEKNFETKKSPFAVAEVDTKSLDDSEISLEQSRIDAEDEEKFNVLTKDSFVEFMEVLKGRGFDIGIPMFQWLKFVSLTWNQTVLPGEILGLYKKIFRIYEDFIDYHSMNQLPPDDFAATFRMSMLYFELLFDEFEETKAEIPDDYTRKKDIFQTNIGFIEDDIECTTMLTRLIWLSYCIQLQNKSYQDALGYLYKLEEVYEVPKYADIAVELKNCKHNKQIDGKTVKDLIVKIERKINLASVQKLYETKNFPELLEILRESVIYSTEPKVNTDNLTLKIQTQIEVFLECLWSLDRIVECLDYAEKSLKYAVDNFLLAPTEFRLEEWASLTNYCLAYIEAATKEESGGEILFELGDNLSRLVQTLSRIIVHQLDTPQEKNSTKSHLINLTIPWTLLYFLVLRENDLNSSRKKLPEEEEFEPMPNTLLMFFTAHEFLGRKQWCMKDNGKFLLFLLDILTPIYRTPMLEPFRDIIAENLEQTTYCLYGYPAKKAKLRHIEEHDAKNIDLTWERAIQLFDLYRPDTLPEFDSFKLSSISSEMEQLIQKIIPLIPKCLDISPFTGEIRKFINGTSPTLPKETCILPAKISSIFYLLADFYFKNQETGKAIKFYINDLTMKPDRFDSWASLSLCKQSKLEMKLNSYGNLPVKDFLEMADQAINCFNQCLKLKKTITILTEFASFTYHLSSFCSRNLKQSSETLSMENFSAIEERKDKFLNISFKCFSEVSEAATNASHELNTSKNQGDSDGEHDEKWYYHFMLGKIAEKRKEPPMVYLNHYLDAAKFLYEDNATYPIKINHSNPSHLAIEALEVFYRISACIMKYLELHSKVNKPTAKFFLKVLKEMSSSPFAYNRAKINKGNINAMKHKLNTTGGDSVTPQKQAKVDEPVAVVETAVGAADSGKKIEEGEALKEADDAKNGVVEKMDTSESVVGENSGTGGEVTPSEVAVSVLEPPIQPVIKTIIADSVSRRGSQETTTTTTSTRTSSSSDSSADSSSDSDSSSSDENETSDKENTFVSQEVIVSIYKMCIKNLEECVTRFPEHYKSTYRLIHHFLNSGDLSDKCRQLLLNNNYKTALGNSINGLFFERKNNNFFNGLWRVPSQEIDRPGNFTTHLSKCVIILMEVLKKTNDYETLIDLAIQLQRNPEADKKYLNDSDKKELFHQAVTCSVQAFKNKLREISGDDKNRELLSLMLDIHKSHRKTSKIFQQKDQVLFSGVLVEVYKEYIKDKMILPDNANLTDLAFKLCQTELNYRKNLEKGIVTPNPNPPPTPQNLQPAVSIAPAPTTSSPILGIKSVSEINKSVAQISSNPGSAPSTPTATPKTSTNSGSNSARTKPRSTKSTTPASSPASMSTLNTLMQMYSNPNLMAMMQQDSSAYLNEYYKALLGSSANPASLLTSQQQMAMMGESLGSLMTGLYGSPLSGNSPTTSPKASSSYEKQFLDSLKKSSSGSSAQLMGLQQNLMSSSLSITTTTMTSTTTSAAVKTSSASKKSSSAMKSSSPQVSISKSSDTIKYSNLFGSNLKLPDLPKSLSITPSMPGTSAPKPARVSDKVKVPKSSSFPKSADMTAASFASQLKSGAGANMQNSYQDFLKNYTAQQSALVTKAKSAPTVGLPSSLTASIVKPQKHKQPSSSSSAQVSAHRKQQSAPPKPAQHAYDFGKNIASSFSNIPMTSPGLSISPFARPASNSPSAGSAVSPPKTLQQKLAERKQQGQQKKKSDEDVIVLD